MKAPKPAQFSIADSLLLLVLGVLAVLLELVPLGLGPTATPSPDILFCVVAFFAVRQPKTAHILIVALLGLFRDMMSDVPIGAATLLMVLTIEALKARTSYFARASFLIEWLSVSCAAATVLLGLWLLVLLTFLQPPYLLVLAMQWLLTALVYPAVAMIMRWVFRVGAPERRRVSRAG